MHGEAASVLIDAQEPANRPAQYNVGIVMQGTETLLEATHRLLATVPRTVTDTEISQGCGVSISWLCMFKKGKIKNPGIVTVQALHDYLAGL